jgi:WLM domain
MKISPQVIAIMFAMLGYLFYMYVHGGPGNLITVKAEKDGREYQVQDLPSKKDAAEMLATIRTNIEKLENYYRQEELQSDPPVKLFIERFRPQNIMENSMTSSDTSYSENKGEKIVLCLRDKTNPPAYPLVELNTVMFVVLHEMAHLMTADLSTTSHTPEFWSNFKRILHDAQRIGIYIPVNYSHSPVEYCGMTITDSPI